MAENFVIGSIQTQQGFLWTAFSDGKKLILDSIKNKQGEINYFWNPNYLNDTKVLSSIPIFSVRSGKTDGQNNALKIISVYFDDLLNSGGIGFLSSSSIIINQKNSAEISPVSVPSLTTWFLPTILLSNASYEFQTTSNIKISIYKDSTLKDVVQYPVILLPITWYGNCNGDKYDVVNTKEGTVLNWTCNVSDPPSICDQILILPNGFTILDDCQIGVIYQYCNQPNLCGSGNCNGPCSQFYYDCKTSSKTLPYQCFFDSEKFFLDTKWYESYYFIIGVAAVALIILILIFILIIIYFRQK